MLCLFVAVCGTFAYLLPRPQAPAIAATELRGESVFSYVSEHLEAAKDGNGPSPLPWLGAIWIAGALAYQLRTLASYFLALRHRRRGVCCPPDYWQLRLNELRAMLCVSGPVRLLESSLAEVPIVIGHIRPFILMPVGLLANLPVQQVETILLHELAHIRRYDYLVNLLQTAIEGLLFYHPALWWFSGVVRAERENCCDDLVVAISGDAHEYAAALAALEENRGTLQAAALAATGGHLVKRIRRLLGQPERSAHLAPVFSAGFLTIAAAVALAAWQVKPATNSPYDRWLNEDVTYIITGAERSSFEQLWTDAEKTQFIKQFWLRRDPTPDTAENEFKVEHYRRIGYANERYAAQTLPGWKTDRGRIYITWGPPDEIESHPSGNNVTPPFEKWRYRGMPQTGLGAFLEFIDSSRTSEYRMSETRIGNIFVSATRGARAWVIVSPERQISPGIPLDFDARQYAIEISVRTTDGQSKWKTSSIVSLCKYAPAESGCLLHPGYEPGPSAILEPGAYILDATISDRSGLTSHSYAVNFTVKQ